MNKDYTHISVILDRTGSMEAIRDDTIGGFNAFLEQQRAEPGKATMTLVQFDSQDPYEVIHRFKPVDKVSELNRQTYVPRAMTPLLDAIGRGINDLEENLGRLKEEEKPSKIVFVIVTDGQENASREFRREQIQKMISDKSEKESWQFVFLSADLAAIGDAMSVGFAADSSLLYAKDRDGSLHAWDSLSKRTSDYRSSRKSKMTFNKEDRLHPQDPGKK
jgi:hypothetical protein